VGKADLQCRSGSCLPLPAGLPAPATRTIGSMAWMGGNSNMGEALGRVTS